MSHEAWSRREFLQTAAVTPFGLTAKPKSDVNLILLMLVGGPSQLDTWDPKPDAPVDIRGPFRPIATNVPGLRFTELFPRMAQIADKFSLIRSVHHTAPAVHAAGYQLMQGGRFGAEQPHIGSVLSYLSGNSADLITNVLLPWPIHDTDGLWHGQGGGTLGYEYDPGYVRGPKNLADACTPARQLVEGGARCVTVNMFTTVYNQITWDTHGWKPFTSLKQLADHVAPVFDIAFSKLLLDLADRGLLDSTIVGAFGEFGRSPRFNHAGGRDHHPGIWTVL